MGKKYNYDYIVIGSGPAGTTAALNLAKAKKRVAIVEDSYFGGTNLNTRDIPYTTALQFSHIYDKIRTLPEFKNQDFHFSFPTLLSHQLSSIKSVGGGDKTIYENAKITCLEGHAYFLDKHTIAIGDNKYTASFFILATGSKLKATEISGVESVKFSTPESAIRIRRLPEVALVIGGGASGCEIATYLAELGAKVIILEMAERLLPREDSEVGTTIATQFSKELGITVLTNSKAIAIEQDSVSKKVIFHDGESEKAVRVDYLVLATGSQPILDYGLEEAGVKYKNTGIIVDKHFQTSAKHIFAIGDAIGKDSSTDRSEYDGMILSTNLINHNKNIPNYKGLCRIVNTSPQVATTGFNEDDLTKRDRKYKKAIVRINETPIGKINNDKYGFVKLLADKKSGNILGATIVAPHAELLIQEIALCVRHDLNVLEIASTPHVVNSYNYAIKLAAKALYKGKK